MKLKRNFFFLFRSDFSAYFGRKSQPCCMSDPGDGLVGKVVKYDGFFIRTRRDVKEERMAN